MRVEFFEGRRSRQKAALANSDELCAVAVTMLRHGAKLECDRGRADLKWEIVPAAFMAMCERHTQEYDPLKRKSYPRDMICSGPTYGCLYVVVAEGMLEGWKKFLREMLSRPESWEPRKVKRAREKREMWELREMEIPF